MNSDERGSDASNHNDDTELEELLRRRIENPSPLIELNHADIDRIIDKAIRERRESRPSGGGMRYNHPR
jgi:hypothetical protein